MYHSGDLWICFIDLKGLWLTHTESKHGGGVAFMVAEHNYANQDNGRAQGHLAVLSKNPSLNY